VIRELIERDGITSVVVAGYSLGGNLALKLAGELGAAGPGTLKAVCAVSPTIDLARCVDALERRTNFVYQWNFVRNLKARMRRKTAAVPGAYSLGPLRDVWTVRRFDDVYTAPHHGFRDSTDYYYRASALRVMDRIRVPTLILAAEDDPFVPAESFSHPSVAGNRYITVRVTPHGGHCAYMERVASATNGGYDGYWAEREVVRFAECHHR
jgi:predicted alpha/beta-fold hydrolase